MAFIPLRARATIDQSGEGRRSDEASLEGPASQSPQLPSCQTLNVGPIGSRLEALPSEATVLASEFRTDEREEGGLRRGWNVYGDPVQTVQNAALLRFPSDVSSNATETSSALHSAVLRPECQTSINAFGEGRSESICTSLPVPRPRVSDFASEPCTAQWKSESASKSAHASDELSRNALKTSNPPSFPESTAGAALAQDGTDAFRRKEGSRRKKESHASLRRNRGATAAALHPFQQNDESRETDDYTALRNDVCEEERERRISQVFLDRSKHASGDSSLECPDSAGRHCERTSEEKSASSLFPEDEGKAEENARGVHSVGSAERLLKDGVSLDERADPSEVSVQQTSTLGRFHEKTLPDSEEEACGVSDEASLALTNALSSADATEVRLGDAARYLPRFKKESLKDISTQQNGAPSQSCEIEGGFNASDTYAESLLFNQARAAALQAVEAFWASTPPADPDPSQGLASSTQMKIAFEVKKRRLAGLVDWELLALPLSLPLFEKALREFAIWSSKAAQNIVEAETEGRVETALDREAALDDGFLKTRFRLFCESWALAAALLEVAADCLCLPRVSVFDSDTAKRVLSLTPLLFNSGGDVWLTLRATRLLEQIFERVVLTDLGEENLDAEGRGYFMRAPVEALEVLVLKVTGASCLQLAAPSPLRSALIRLWRQFRECRPPSWLLLETVLAWKASARTPPWDDPWLRVLQEEAKASSSSRIQVNAAVAVALSSHCIPDFAFQRSDISSLLKSAAPSLLHESVERLTESKRLSAGQKLRLFIRLWLLTLRSMGSAAVSGFPKGKVAEFGFEGVIEGELAVLQALLVCTSSQETRVSSDSSSLSASSSSPVAEASLSSVFACLAVGAACAAGGVDICFCVSWIFLRLLRDFEWPVSSLACMHGALSLLLPFFEQCDVRLRKLAASRSWTCAEAGAPEVKNSPQQAVHQAALALLGELLAVLAKCVRRASRGWRSEPLSKTRPLRGCVSVTRGELSLLSKKPFKRRECLERRSVAPEGGEPSLRRTPDAMLAPQRFSSETGFGKKNDIDEKGVKEQTQKFCDENERCCVPSWSGGEQRKEMSVEIGRHAAYLRSDWKTSTDSTAEKAKSRSGAEKNIQRCVLCPDLRISERSNRFGWETKAPLRGGGSAWEELEAVWTGQDFRPVLHHRIAAALKLRLRRNLQNDTRLSTSSTACRPTLKAKSGEQKGCSSFDGKSRHYSSGRGVLPPTVTPMHRHSLGFSSQLTAISSLTDLSTSHRITSASGVNLTPKERRSHLGRRRDSSLSCSKAAETETREKHRRVSSETLVSAQPRESSFKDSSWPFQETKHRNPHSPSRLHLASLDCEPSSAVSAWKVSTHKRLFSKGDSVLLADRSSAPDARLLRNAVSKKHSFDALSCAAPSVVVRQINQVPTPVVEWTSQHGSSPWYTRRDGFSSGVWKDRSHPLFEATHDGSAHMSVPVWHFENRVSLPAAKDTVSRNMSLLSEGRAFLPSLEWREGVFAEGVQQGTWEKFSSSVYPRPVVENRGQVCVTAIDRGGKDILSREIAQREALRIGVHCPSLSGEALSQFGESALAASRGENDSTGCMHIPQQVYHQPTLSLGPPPHSDGRFVEISLVRSRPRGLRNLGNSCYLNSLLQALFLCDCFVSNLFRFSFKEAKGKDELSCGGGAQSFVSRDLLSALQFLCVELALSRKEVLDAGAVLQCLPCVYQQQQQQDVSEAAHALFEMLGGHEQMLLRLTFAGWTLQRVECSVCLQQSQRVEVVSGFSFSLPTDRAFEQGFPGERRGTDPDPGKVLSNHRELLRPSVQTMFQEFVRREILSGENQYACETCGKKRDATKWQEIASPPAHLVVTLNRYGWDAVSNERSKLPTHVHANEHLSVCGFQYELYAAIIHAGKTANSGHYYCIGRRSETSRGTHRRRWFCFDDSAVTEVEENSINTISMDSSKDDVPYMLFYRCIQAPRAPPCLVPARLCSFGYALPFHQECTSIKFARSSLADEYMLLRRTNDSVVEYFNTRNPVWP